MIDKLEGGTKKKFVSYFQNWEEREREREKMTNHLV